MLQHRLGPIEYHPIGSLTAYEKNPRRHPEKQIVKLAASIREFGFALPVLVDADRTIIAGHARVEAARRLGVAEVPVLVAADWSKEQERAYRLADNRLAELATWDDELLAIELSALIEVNQVAIELRIRPMRSHSRLRSLCPGPATCGCSEVIGSCADHRWRLKRGNT